MSIWKRDFDAEYLNEVCEATMISHLKIVFGEIGEDWLEADMPVNETTCQPYGMLHGGASAALAETVASLAGNMCCAEDKCCLGQNLSVTHLRPVFGGSVRARAMAVHIGISSQTWRIDVTDNRGRLVCSASMTLAVCKRRKLAHHA